MRDPREIELIRLLLPAGRPIRLGELLERTGIHADELPVFMEDFRQSEFVYSQTENTIQALKEPESLLPEMILAGLQTHTIGRDVLVFRETSSTNDRARQAGVAGAGEGLVVFAESQTGGRGTRGRKWVHGRSWSMVFDSPPDPRPGRLNGRCCSRWRRWLARKPLRCGSSKPSG